MGREIKRVALDFEWPLDKVWQGFLNPHSEGHCTQCVVCQGSGLSRVAKLLQDQWYGKAEFWPALTGSMPFLPEHPAIQERAVRNYPDSAFRARNEAQRLAELFNTQWSHHLDADDVAALCKATRLRLPQAEPTSREVNEWSITLGNFGHDSINCWIVVSAKCERLGLPDTCDACKGEGSVWDSEENRKRHDEWEQIPPPDGDGWQVWETVSEGSPITPVFATADELAAYLAEYGDLWDQKRGDGGWGIKRAKAFVSVGWTMSAASVNGKFLESKDIPLHLAQVDTQV